MNYAERWASVKECEGYEFSDSGRVRSYWKYRQLANHRYERTLSIESKNVQPTAHYRDGKVTNVTIKVSKWKGVWKRKSKPLSHLILMAFGHYREEGQICCHNNGDPADNRLSNLRWDTYSSNVVDQVFHGTLRGLQVNPEVVPEIWKMLVDGQTSKQISKLMGVPVESVNKIRIKQTFTYITDFLEGTPSRRKPTPWGPAQYIDEKYCDKNIEVWKTVPGYKEYRVSNTARIQCCRVDIAKGYRRKSGDPVIVGNKWRDVTTFFSREGYEKVRFLVNRKRISMSVHRLVLLAFMGPNPPGMIGCHNDGNKKNNHSSNLRWDTPTSNNKDRFAHEKLRENSCL